MDTAFVKDVIDGMSKEQKDVMYHMVAVALNERDTIWSAPPEAPNFIRHFAGLNDIAMHMTDENFVKIQKLQADILNDYTAGNISESEKRTLYGAATIIMDYMREKLRPKEGADNGTKANQDGSAQHAD